MNHSAETGIQIPRILLPNPSIDLTRWSVIAVDQYTSQPDYWQQVQDFVGDSPSTLHMVLPEIYLGKPEEHSRISGCNTAMRAYLQKEYFQAVENPLLVERLAAGRTRHGLMLALDLEQYDFHKGSTSLIRATEDTILERIPPRQKIRQEAQLEIPHIMVLIDDPGRTVIEPLVAQKKSLKCLYDFDLMMESGHLRGYQVDQANPLKEIFSALRQLADPDSFSSRYNLDRGTPVLLFAIGDGNHSLATAKTIWTEKKEQFGLDHPARYALVEVVNLHDDGLVFHPIHRILFNTHRDVITGMQQYFGNQVTFIPWIDRDDFIKGITTPGQPAQAIGVVTGDLTMQAVFHQEHASLAVASLQNFLDEWLVGGGAEGIDYVHGEDVVLDLGTQPGNAGFFLPPMPKGDLFKTVIRDGTLPRKSFSMGEAHEKRFYLECRRITQPPGNGKMP